MKSRSQSGSGNEAEGEKLLNVQQDGTIAADDKSKSKNDFGLWFLAGYTLAGVASALLTTVFGLFHVDVFLRAYRLPLPTYATGNFIYSFINTANDLGGAWLVDSIATNSSRSDMVGISGCLFALCFLSPFFRPFAGGKVSSFWGGAHFVTVLSLYDTMFSFTAILLGSVVTDNSNMSDRDRVRFMASGKVANLVVSFAVARIGLAVFKIGDLTRFRYFVLVLAFAVSIMFIVAQSIMTKSRPHLVDGSEGNRTNPQRKKNKLQLRRVVRDFCSHGNFRAWIGMEMLLECQSNFLSSFLKTFVDGLVFEGGVSRASCDWILSLIRPVTQIAGILCYVPIRRMGYQKLYTLMFVTNLSLSVICLLFGSPLSTYLIVAFLVVYSVVTGAVSSAGFHLAMSDMVLEMKSKHASENRFDEPSLAGLFMGANALLCKPMDSFLPIVAATFLRKTDFSSGQSSDSTRWVLFYLLLVPPLTFSCLQLLSWSRYNLHPRRTKELREDLKQMHSAHDEEMDYLI